MPPEQHLRLAKNLADLVIRPAMQKGDPGRTIEYLGVDLGEFVVRRVAHRHQRVRCHRGQAGDAGALGAGGLRATPQNSSTSAGWLPASVRSGRQREHDTTPGGSRSSPSKNRVICAGVRKVIDGVPTRFQCATASSMAAPWTALVEWLMARKLPGASADTRCRTIEYACSVSGMWC